MPTLIVYFSKYGQTEKIARRIGKVLQSSGCEVEIMEASQACRLSAIDYYEQIVLGSPIYTGKHSKLIAKFVRRFLDQLAARQTAFFSVSASAAGNEKQREDARRCMNQFLQRLQWQPQHQTIFAGSIHYTQYNWVVRMLMKWIAKREGGDTDTSRDYEYTDWNRVDEFAQSLVVEQDAVLN